MTVAESTGLNEFTGNGTKSLYTTDFRIIENDDLFVFLDSDLLVEGVDYFIQNSTETSVQVQFVTAPASGVDIRLERRTDVTQEVDFKVFGPFAAQNNELVHDKPTMILQEVISGGRASLARSGRNLGVLRSQTAVVVTNDRGDNATLPVWSGIDGNAGMLAAEIVEEQGPANGAPTTKGPGFLWMQFGEDGLAPYTPESFTEGYFVTQDQFYSGADHPNPFDGVSYPKFTMSCVWRNTAAIGTAQRVMFQMCGAIANAMAMMYIQKAGANDGIRFKLKQQTGLSAGNDIESNMIITLGSGKEMNYAVNDWVWSGVSYSQPDNLVTFAARNLTKILSYSESQAPTGNFNVDGYAPAAIQQSANGWGVEPKDSLQFPWLGSLTQVFMHNGYLDLTSAANVNKFCGTDGVIDMLGGYLPFGVQPLVFFNSGDPRDNVGSLDIDSGGYIIETPFAAGPTPPVAS